MLPPKTQESLCRRSQIWEEGFKTLIVSKFQHLRSKIHQMGSTGVRQLSLRLFIRNPVIKINSETACMHQWPMNGSNFQFRRSRETSNLWWGLDRIVRPAEHRQAKTNCHVFPGTGFRGSSRERHFSPKDLRIALSAVAN